MRSFLASVLLCMFALCIPAAAQESGWVRWTLQPHISLGKLLPGESIDYHSFDFFSAEQQAYAYGVASIQYTGTSVGFGFRAFPEECPWLAVVLGGGVTWFSRPGPNVTVFPATATGVGTQLAPSDFTVYPLTLGLQATYPSGGTRDFMLFAGVEGTANFVSGELPMNQSVKGGFGLAAGFAVKVFEMGMRYQAFSDMRNLGVYLSFRLNPFEVDFSPKSPSP